MKATVSQLTGVEKAAILLMQMGEEVASQIFSNLGDSDIQKIGTSMSLLHNVPPGLVKEVMNEFIRFFEGEGKVRLAGGEQYLKKVLSKAVGNKKAEEIVKGLAVQLESGPFSTLQNLDPIALGNFLAMEHPQTIAVVLAHLNPDQAAAVLKYFSEDLQKEVVLRIANMGRIDPELIGEIEKALEKDLKLIGNFAGSNRKAGGIESAAEMLNRVDHSTETAILSQLEEESPDVADSIRKLMFVFDDLVNVDDRGMQSVLKEVGKEELVVALKTASDELKEKIFKNMSERAAEMLREDFEALGPMRVSDIEKAQQTIIRVAKSLEEKGEIAIAAGGGEETLV